MNQAENFNISDQNSLQSIATACFDKHPSRILMHFHKFNIQSQDFLINFVKKGMKCAPEYIAQNFQQYNIEDETERYNIAFYLIETSPQLVAHIEKFNISNEKYLNNLAFIGDSSVVVRNFNLFHISEEKVSIALVKKLLQNSDYFTLHAMLLNFNMFQITDRAALLDIAKLFKGASAELTAINISKFNIEDKGEFLKILKFCLRKSTYTTAGTFKKVNSLNYNLNTHEWKELVGLCLHLNFSAFAANISPLSEDKSHYFPIIKSHLNKDLINSINKGDADLENRIESYLNTDFQNPSFKIIADKIKILSHNRKERMQEFGKILLLMQLFLTNEDKDDVGKFKILENLMIFGRPELRLSIAFELFAYWSKDPIAAKELFSTMKKGNASNLWIKVLLERVKQGGISDTAVEDFAKIIDMKEGPFAKGTNSQIVIEFLLLLLSNEAFEVDIKEKIIKKICIESVEIAQKLAQKRAHAEASMANGKLQYIERLQQLINDTVKTDDDLREELRNIASKLEGNTLRHLKRVLDRSPLKPALEEYLAGFATRKKMATWKKMSNAEQSVKLTRTDIGNESLSNIQIASGIFRSQNSSLFSELESVGLSELFETEFCKRLPLDNIKDFNDRFLKHFGRDKNSALLNYLSKIQAMKNPEAALKAFERFFVGVLEGKYFEDRYNLDDNIHLRNIEKRFPGTVKCWAEALPPMDVEATHTKSDELFDCKKWLTEKLLDDQHLLPRDEFQNTLFGLFLSNPSEESRLKYYAQVKINNASDEFKLQKKLFELYSKTNKDQQVGALREIAKLLKRSLSKPEFLNDVESVLHSLQVQTTAASVKVYDTDEACDMFYCGEVGGSCQRLDGNINYNKALFGYVLHGQNRLLAIFDSQGKMVARCLLRLLTDGKNLVIFRERFYPSTLSESQREAINAMALEKAKALGVPLTSYDGNGPSYEKNLISEGGPAPWEYCDAATGIHENGEFTINKKDLRLMEEKT